MLIGKETEKVEFKLSTGELKEACEAICAILNKHKSGELYFGVDDNGYVKGQQISDGTIRDVAKIIGESIEPKINPSIMRHVIDGKEVLKVDFAGANRPYSVKGMYLVRVGTANRKMPTDELRRLLTNDDYSSKWEYEPTEYGVFDIDDEALFDFYVSAVNCGRLEMKSYDKEKLLVMLDLLKDGRLNNAGFALFGNSAKINLKTALFASENKVTFLDLKMASGNIYNLVNLGLKYLLDKIEWRVEIGKRKRMEIPEIPEEALREIVVNSFAHASYDNLTEIEINIYPKKIEIYNPGTFPDGLTPLDFIGRNLPSYKRNKLILDVLFRSKDVEKSGTGFQRVAELCKAKGVNWTFRKEPLGFFFEFIRSNDPINAQNDPINAQNDPINAQNDPINDPINDGKDVCGTIALNESEHIILDLIASNPNVTRVQIAAAISKSEATAKRILASLCKKGVVKRVGSRKSGSWVVQARDPFYSNENIACLKRSIAQMEATGGTVHEVDLDDKGCF